MAETTQAKNEAKPAVSESDDRPADMNKTAKASMQEAPAEAEQRVDQIRDILFGAQRDEYDRRFTRLEELLVKSISDLSNETAQKMGNQRTEYDQRFTRLEELLVKSISDLGNETTEKLKAFFNQNNIPVFGVAGADSLEAGPLGYKPSDLLESAESILCIGIPIPKGIFLCKTRSEQMYWRTVNVYYRHMDGTLIGAANIIEKRDEIAVPVFGCYPFDIKGRGDFWGNLSLVKMAEAVGIGKTGKNSLLFNAKYGPRLIARC